MLEKASQIPRRTLEGARNLSCNKLKYFITPFCSSIVSAIGGVIVNETLRNPTREICIIDDCKVSVQETSVAVAFLISSILFTGLSISESYSLCQKATQKEKILQEKKSLLERKKTELGEILSSLPAGTPSKSIFLILPIDDWNGAIFDQLANNRTFFQELSRYYQIIPIWASGRDDLTEKVEAARRSATLPIDAVIINTHGGSSTLNLSDISDDQSSCDSKDLGKIFNFLTPHSRLFLFSCSAGKLDKLTHEISKELKEVQVYGAINITNNYKRICFVDEAIKRPSVRFLDDLLEENMTTICTEGRQTSTSLTLSELRSLEISALNEHSPKKAFYLGREHQIEGSFERACQWYQLCKKWGPSFEKAVVIALLHIEDKRHIPSSGNPADPLILRELPDLSAALR